VRKTRLCKYIKGVCFKENASHLSATGVKAAPAGLEQEAGITHLLQWELFYPAITELIGQLNHYLCMLATAIFSQKTNLERAHMTGYSQMPPANFQLIFPA